jgi:hypothetical protein
MVVPIGRHLNVAGARPEVAVASARP